jgi:shikimate dehydrogenase
LEPHHKKALVLGTGGAAKAVQYALKALGIEFIMVSRFKTDQTITYNDIDQSTLEKFPLIINTSPVGMYPNVDEAPQLPYEHLSSKHLLFDLIYNPEKTAFLQRGEEQGSKICNGAEMLILQAEESWRIWNNNE